MRWLRGYAWLRVKMKAKGSGVQGGLSWGLDNRTTQFIMHWLRVCVATHENKW